MTLLYPHYISCLNMIWWYPHCAPIFAESTDSLSSAMLRLSRQHHRQFPQRWPQLTCVRVRLTADLFIEYHNMLGISITFYNQTRNTEWNIRHEISIHVNTRINCIWRCVFPVVPLFSWRIGSWHIDTGAISRLHLEDLHPAFKKRSWYGRA